MSGHGSYFVAPRDLGRPLVAKPARAHLPTEVLLSLVLAVILGVAVLPLPYDYYTVLRWVILVVGGVLGWKSRSLGEMWQLAVVVTVAIFNPVIPLRLARATWRYVDLAAAMFFLVVAAAYLGRRRQT